MTLSNFFEAVSNNAQTESQKKAILEDGKRIETQLEKNKIDIFKIFKKKDIE